MTTTPYMPYIQMESFMANDGYVIYIKNPTIESLIPLYDQLTLQYPYLSSRSNSGDPTRYFYSFTNWSMNKATTSPYSDDSNPALIFSVSADDTICGCFFVYETEINSEPHIWANNWVALADYKGAGSIGLYIGIGIYSMRGFNLSTNLDARFNNIVLQDALNDRPAPIQDPTTLWHMIDVPFMQNNVRTNYEFGQELPYLSKINVKYPETNEACVLDWNNLIWYPKSEAPQDLGVPQIFEDAKFYKLNYDNVYQLDPFIIPWK